jgi:mannose-6-phosphate isomerase-like protein (cupin superfamily)
MPPYTIKNLKEVEDQAPKFGLSPDLEVRFGRVPLECENLGITYQRIAPNFRLPFGHKHKQQEEVYLLVSGSARVKVGDDVHELKPWDAVRVSKETTRSLEAGPEGAEFVAVGAPNTGPGDAETEQGWWSD